MDLESVLEKHLGAVRKYYENRIHQMELHTQQLEGELAALRLVSGRNGSPNRGAYNRYPPTESFFEVPSGEYFANVLKEVKQ